MAEFERAQQMPADAEQVFDIVSDVEHLDRWLPSVVSVHLSDVQAVDVDVQRPDGEHHGNGTVGVHRDPGHSSVTLHLSFLGDQLETHGGDAAADIQGQLDNALSPAC
jgi:carbon monoxide dehydrogenase subunit G